MVAVSLKKFFFQAEDGIRDWSVTGVQTCALPIYICHSWLLGPELSEILGENSNIGKFRSFFHVVLRDYDTREAEERIFKMVQENVSVYPETTSLQRAAKQFLMEGGHLGNGVGILKESCMNCR